MENHPDHITQAGLHHPPGSDHIHTPRGSGGLCPRLKTDKGTETYVLGEPALLAPLRGPSGPSMLDNNIHNRTKEKLPFVCGTEYERKVKRKKGRYYHCLVSGMKWHAGDDLYFLTLTSSPQSPDIYPSFHRLTIDMSRVTPSWLIDRDYMSYSEAIRWYPTDKWDTPLKFDYIKQHTSEGHGVLHIIFAGDHWPVSFFRKRWIVIHKATQLVIRYIPSNDEIARKKVVSYQMKQYLYNQDAFIRYSCSRHWLFPGYRKVWVGMIETYGFENALVKWGEMLQLKRMPGQINFDGKTLMTKSDRRESRLLKSKI